MAIQSLKGMRDILPNESGLFNHIEECARRVFAVYGFREIVTPILEETALFKKSIGESTDIVQKEMYAFHDRGGRDICLRPEGTAAVVRAAMQHGLVEENNITKLFYTGPMFRAERPQAGRLRQFYQIGAEAFGSGDPLLDAEIIALNHHILLEFGIEGAHLKINSLGTGDDKERFRKILREKLSGKKKELCEVCQQRFEVNVLRVLDCKNAVCGKVLKAEMIRIDFLSKESVSHFKKVEGYLSSLDISFAEDPYLVRGLDYYTHTVFEFTSDSLGAQDAVSAGGRYDNLFGAMGSRESVGACGFAMGVDRLMMILRPGPERNPEARGDPRPDVFIAALGERAKNRAFYLQSSLRMKKISVSMDFFDKPLKKQLKTANKAGALTTCIIGENEIESKRILLKIMRTEKQLEIAPDDFAETVVKIVNEERGFCV